MCSVVSQRSELILEREWAKHVCGQPIVELVEFAQAVAVTSGIHRHFTGLASVLAGPNLEVCLRQNRCSMQDLLLPLSGTAKLTVERVKPG
jgi:hypothetical protein